MPDSKLTAVVTVAAALAPAVVAQPDILGIPPGVLLAACAGALFGLAYTPPEAWGRLLAVPAATGWPRYGWIGLRAGGLVFTLLANALACSWAVAALPHLPGMAWAKGIPGMPAAGLLAFAGQHIIPKALDWLGRKLAPPKAGPQ